MYVIGIDGGGTKTRATIYQVDSGQPVYSVETGRANFVVHYQESLDEISRAIQLCYEHMGKTFPEKILVGASGAHSSELCTLVEEELINRWPCEIHVMDDAQLAHTALLEGNDGILIIAGTGSIVLGRYQGIEWKTGGWGYLLGDEGSGYWISIKAIQYAMHQLEARNKSDMLTKAILHRVKGNSMSDIKNFVYSASRQELAALSELIHELATEHCEAAISILRRAGVELALLLKRAVSLHISPFPQLKIAVAGSLLLKNEIVFRAFKEVVVRDYPDSELFRENRDVCKAVLYHHSNHV